MSSLTYQSIFKKTINFLCVLAILTISITIISAQDNDLNEPEKTSKENLGNPAQYLDYFGNGLTDFAVFTFPSGGTSLRWRILKNENPPMGGGTIMDIPFGNPASDQVPNQGDYTGNGVTDLAIYRGSTGSPNPNSFYIQPLNANSAPGTPYSVQFGNSTTDGTGAAGDYDGDGKMDLTVVRDTSTTGGPLVWYVLRSSDSTVMYYYFGNSITDIAMPGSDYTGDGVDNPTIIRVGGDSAATITWIYGDSASGTAISYTPWGSFLTDFAVPGGDYDGDGRADFMVWRGFGTGTNGNWYLRTSAGTTSQVKLGTGGGTGVRDTALRGGDYDGDGKDDIAVYRPSTMTFYVLRSSGGVQTQQWGISGNTNIPIAAFGVQ